MNRLYDHTKPMSNVFDNHNDKYKWIVNELLINKNATLTEDIFVSNGTVYRQELNYWCSPEDYRNIMKIVNVHKEFNQQLEDILK